MRSWQPDRRLRWRTGARNHHRRRKPRCPTPAKIMLNTLDPAANCSRRYWKAISSMRPAWWCAEAIREELLANRFHAWWTRSLDESARSVSTAALRREIVLSPRAHGKYFKKPQRCWIRAQIIALVETDSYNPACSTPVGHNCAPPSDPPVSWKRRMVFARRGLLTKRSNARCPRRMVDQR